MPSRYQPLTEALRTAAAQGRAVVEMTFDEVAGLVGGLPPSADLRQWWANSSQNQSLSWRAAGFHVDQVHLDRRRVRFARGERGGSYHDRGRVALEPATRPLAPTEYAQPGAPVDVRVEFRWLEQGPVELDTAGKPVFPRMPAVEGLYRLTLTGGVAGPRPRIYVGETDNLHRRLSSNYRSPGPSQQTSLRINGLLREHLAAGGEVALATATTATLWLAGGEQALDLSRKAGRLLAESAALVLARATDDADIVNLG